MKIREEEKMDESSGDDLFDKRDFRKKKEKKRSHKSSKEKEECTKESFKKMKEEIDELRRKEVERSKELDALKEKIEKTELERAQTTLGIEYALEFDKSAYLSKGFIESAQWIKNVLAKNFIEMMNADENKKRFELFMINKKHSSHIGIRACARFNRGEECSLGKWHSTHKSELTWTGKNHQFKQQSRHNAEGSSQDTVPRRNEMRLHVCTLCLEALGSANGHSVLDCPWILKKNWNE